jgi:hypothetical protein
MAHFFTNYSKILKEEDGRENLPKRCGKFEIS